MREAFGFDAPLYRSMSAPPPMLGVFTRVPVQIAEHKVDLSIYHMIAPDLCAYADGTPTADLRALIETAGGAVNSDDLLYAAARKHAEAWYLAFAAAREHGFKKLSDVLVGGGAFIPEDWSESFKVKVHGTALYLIGYGAQTFAFPEIELVPPPARVPLHDLEGWRDVLHLNAWCHSSFLGNGNRVDNSLDGGWGRSTPIAPFAWPPSNPWMSLCAVGNMPQTPAARPKDRLCGKPPQQLRRMRSSEGASGAPPRQPLRKTHLSTNAATSDAPPPRSTNEGAFARADEPPPQRRRIDAAAADAASHDTEEERRAWETHVRTLRPELQMPRARAVSVQLGESDNSFQGAEALVDEIRRKGDSVHFILKYHGHEVVVRFRLRMVNATMSVLTVSSYAAPALFAETEEELKVGVTLVCTDEHQESCRECVKATTAQWPTPPEERDIKTMVALSDYSKTRAEDDEIQLTLDVVVMGKSDEPPADDNGSIEDR